MKKRVFYAEFAYLLGVALLAFGTALVERGDLGMSMAVAPAYVLHLKVSQTLPFFTFGIAEYVLQAIVMIVMLILIRKWKHTFLMTAVTTLLYGFLLDLSIGLVALLPHMEFWARLGVYTVGMLLIFAGVAMLFHTYLAPAAYELFIKEVSAKWNFDIHKCKTVYDCTSCLIAILMSFAFFGFGQFQGVKLGTVIAALCGGTFVKLFSRLYERLWDFRDLLPLRKYF